MKRDNRHCWSCILINKTHSVCKQRLLPGTLCHKIPRVSSDGFILVRSSAEISEVASPRIDFTPLQRHYCYILPGSDLSFVRAILIRNDLLI